MILQLALMYALGGPSTARATKLSAKVAGREFVCGAGTEYRRTMAFNARATEVTGKGKYMAGVHPVTWRGRGGRVDYAQDLEELTVRGGRLFVDDMGCEPPVGE